MDLMNGVLELSEVSSRSPMTPAAGVDITGAAAGEVLVLDYEVPVGWEGNFRGWGIALSVPEMVNTLRLALKVNGEPLPCYPNGITQHVGGIRADELEEVYHVIPAGKVLQLFAGSQTSGKISARFKILLRRVEA